jgi:hypothetical protein
MTYFIVLAAVLARFVPHVPNFSPVYGALLFGGARLKGRDSVWYPLALLAASDFVLTTRVYHLRMGWREEVLDLVAFAVLALLGRSIRNRISARTVLSASLAGAVAFFLISNFAVWLGWKMYPATWEGLMACYMAALPFFRHTLESSLLYSAVVFGGHELWKFAAARAHRPRSVEPV